MFLPFSCPGWSTLILFCNTLYYILQQRKNLFALTLVVLTELIKLVKLPRVIDLSAYKVRYQVRPNSDTRRVVHGRVQLPNAVA